LSNKQSLHEGLEDFPLHATWSYGQYARYGQSQNKKLGYRLNPCSIPISFKSHVSRPFLITFDASLSYKTPAFANSLRLLDMNDDIERIGGFLQYNTEIKHLHQHHR
jgi:hypothetical protein